MCRVFNFFASKLVLCRLIMSNSSSNTLTTMCANEDNGCVFLSQVQGYDCRWNDLIVVPRISTTQTAKSVVYFGGDIQNCFQNMQKHAEYRNYAPRWSLESTAKNLLAKRFPDSTIFVVRPQRMQAETFSIFANFVKCHQTDETLPIFTADNRAWDHLKELIFNGLKAIGSCQENVKIVLVAFSKGSVVLNQLISEIPTAVGRSDVVKFMKSVEEWYWLDAGNAGQSDAYITDEKLLSSLKNSFKTSRFHVHVTPYQTRDTYRPWIALEEQKFVKILQSYGADISETTHFKKEKRSIVNHFRVLEEF